MLARQRVARLVGANRISDHKVRTQAVVRIEPSSRDSLVALCEKPSLRILLLLRNTDDFANTSNQVARSTAQESSVPPDSVALFFSGVVRIEFHFRFEFGLVHGFDDFLPARQVVADADRRDHQRDDAVAQRDDQPLP